MSESTPPGSSPDARTTIFALALLLVAVAIGIVALSGALTSNGPERAAELSTASVGRTYYVGRRSCSDKRAGRSARAPWCSVTHALGAAPRGSTIRVAPGRYSRLGLDSRRRYDITVVAADRSRPPVLLGASVKAASGLVLDGLRFASSVAIVDSTRVTIQHGTFPGTSIYVHGGQSIRIVGNQLRHLRGARRAINIQGAFRPGDRPTRDVVVDGNRIDDTQHDAIDVYNGYERVSVSNNYITNVRQPPGVGFHTDAIQLTGGDGLTMRGNRVDEVTHGIIIKNFVPTTNAVISDNVVTNVDGAALQLYNAPGVQIRHNTFWYSQVSLVLNDDAAVTGTTSATVDDNVLQQIVVVKRGLVAGATRNVFRYGSGVGEPQYRGTPRFRDEQAGDFRLDAADTGVGVPTGSELPGTSQGPRP